LEVPVRSIANSLNDAPARRVHRPLIGLGVLLAASLLFLAGLLTGEARAAAPATDYVVLFRASEEASDRAKAERRKGNRVEDVFTSRVNGLVARLDPADVKRLRNDPDVLAIERDGVVRALGVRDSATTLWGLDRIDQRSRPGNGRITTSNDGTGVTAYVVDTGIRPDHTQFESRVAARGFTAFSDEDGWNDCQGHGTHVAGTVAGKDYGVAPEAELVSVRVLGCNGSGSYSGVIAGIDWVAADHQAGQPAVANLSLGGGYSSTMNAAIQRAVNDGVTVAVAAGNDNSDACSASPASAPAAITVGATTSTDSRSSFSNYGTCLDIFAPGSGILSSTMTSTTSTASWSGTSMASPHVAGAAALLLSGEPSLTPAEVTDRISSSSTTGVVTGPGIGSLNRLLYVGDPAVPNPVPEPEPEPEPPAPDPPANDDFADAASLFLAATSGTNVGATRETGEPLHGWNASRSVWYSWTSPADGTLTISTEGSDYDTILAAYAGSSLGSLVQRAANDDNGSGGLWSRVTFEVMAGTTYRVVVDGYYGAAGTISLSGSFTAAPEPPPPDDTPPEAPVLNGPTGLVRSTSATFTFSGEPGGSFQCSLDDGAWANCSSPTSRFGLDQGDHVFSVRQADAAGNISTPTSLTWTVDTVAPAAPVLTSTPDPTAFTDMATFAFTGEAGGSFTCSLDYGAWEACASPVDYVRLTVGSHTFRVRQTDEAGNLSSSSVFDWEVRTKVDGLTPTLTGPDAEGMLSFGGAEPGLTYLCRVGESVSGPLSECQNPFAPEGLTDGTYSYRLVITDDQGNRSSEATGTFTITDTPEPPPGQVGVSINSGDTFTTDRQVSLGLVWPAGTRTVIVAADGSLATEPVPIANPTTFTLPTTGSERLPKTVYVRFLGAGGSVLGTQTDDIVLDETAPTVSAGRLIERSGGRFTMRLPAFDTGSGLGRFQFSASRKRPSNSQGDASRRSYRASGKVVSARRAARPRWFRVSDRAGNWSKWSPIRRTSR
jgi:subtilisin family serine protease